MMSVEEHEKTVDCLKNKMENADPIANKKRRNDEPKKQGIKIIY